MERDHYIRAESRATGKRVRITENMTKVEAEAWKPAIWDKNFFKYFRVVKDNDDVKNTEKSTA